MQWASDSVRFVVVARMVVVTPAKRFAVLDEVPSMFEVDVAQFVARRRGHETQIARPRAGVESRRE